MPKLYLLLQPLEPPIVSTFRNIPMISAHVFQHIIVLQRIPRDEMLVRPLNHKIARNDADTIFGRHGTMVFIQIGKVLRSVLNPIERHIQFLARPKCGMDDTEEFARVAARVGTASISTAEMKMDVVGVEVEVVDFVGGLGVTDSAVGGLDEGVSVEAADRGVWSRRCYLACCRAPCFDPLETERPLTREFEPSGFGDEIERIKGRGGHTCEFSSAFFDTSYCSTRRSCSSNTSGV